MVSQKELNTKAVFFAALKNSSKVRFEILSRIEAIMHMPRWLQATRVSPRLSTLGANLLFLSRRKGV